MTEGDAAQYAVAQLRLPQAHKLVRGMNVTIAVIDLGVDVKHPELVNSVADSFDALAARKARMSTAPALPARSWRMAS